MEALDISNAEMRTYAGVPGVYYETPGIEIPEGVLYRHWYFTDEEFEAEELDENLDWDGQHRYELK